MQRAIGWLGVLALSAGVYACGNDLLRDALPILLTSFIAWLFARTLRAGRLPLIARVIAAIDGAGWLEDPTIARYARRLTQLWAAYLFLLAAIIAMLALLARYGAATWPWMPTAQHFGAIGMPLAVAILLLGEFFLRSRLLPQAPRHNLFGFARGLIMAWPHLLDDRAAANVRENRDAGRMP